MAWEGEERREHDIACDRRIEGLRKEVCPKIAALNKTIDECHGDMKTKADKSTLSGGFKLLWGVMSIIVFGLILGGGYGYSQNEGMRAVNTKQDTNIESIKETDKHLEKTIDKLDEKFEEHLSEQRMVNQQILEKLSTIGAEVQVIKSRTE